MNILYFLLLTCVLLLLFVVDSVATIHSPVPCVFSFRIFGDLENYTFLETLGSTESEKQFFLSILWQPSWIFKMATVFPEIWQYLSF